MHKADLKQMTVSSLIVDPDVQRNLDIRRVNKIVEEFNADALGTLTVSHRASGAHHIIDGQHRAAAVRVIGGDDKKVLCRIFNGLTIQEEAEMFRLLNNTAKPQVLDLFRVRVVEGEPTAVAITEILAGHGWTVGFGSSHTKTMLAAVSAVERVYRLDPTALERALGTATRAWGHDAVCADGRLVEGLGLVYYHYDNALDPTELTARLARYAGGPAALLGKARGLKEMVGGSVPNSVADIIVEVYNRARRTKALPPWRSQ